MLSNLLLISAFFTLATAHAAFFHPSMYGFNVTASDFPYDNRAVAPLTKQPFNEWWMHGHMDFPPNEGDIFELPAGTAVNTEISCNKGGTSYFATSEGRTDQRTKEDPESPCPNSPMSSYHTLGVEDLTGCALAIAYKSDVRAVVPEDFAVFSVNQTCVWKLNTAFEVPERMPPCPEGGCICSFFWIHSQFSGGEQNYMNAFKCNVTGSISEVPIAPPQLPRRCGEDPLNDKMEAAPANCTYGSKQPFYWFQSERNNMFEGEYSPPFYTDLYNFLDGAQEDIFEDSYEYLPVPSENQTDMPILRAAPPSASLFSFDKATGAPSFKMLAASSSNGTDSALSLEEGGESSANDSVEGSSSSSGKCHRKAASRGEEETPSGSTGGLRKRVLAMSRRSRRLTKKESLWSLW